MDTDFFASLLNDLDATVFNAPLLSPPLARPTTHRVKPRAARSPSSAHKRVALDPCIPTQATATRSVHPVSPPLLTSTAEPQSAYDALCDGFDGFENEEEEIRSSPTPPTSARWAGREPRPPGHIPLSRRYVRATVESVESVLQVDDGPSRKNLLVRVGTNDSILVRLEDDWIQTLVDIDDVVHLIGEVSPATTESAYRTMRITRAQNYIIVHPDTLLSATKIADAPQCARKPVMQEKVRGVSRSTPSLVYGNILHALLQSCLTAQRWDDDFRHSEISRLVREHSLALWEIEIDFRQAHADVAERSDAFATWAATYVGDAIKPDAKLIDPHGSNEQARVVITDIHDIEEDIYSPKFGMKGKVDVSALMRVSIDDATGDGRSVAPTSTPVEIKTGRSINVMEHRAQTMLYTLLMSERYDTDVTAGLLFYTQGNELIRVGVARNELRGLIIARNEVAHYLHPRENCADEDVDDEDEFPQGPANVDNVVRHALPTPIDQERTCARCYASDACMLFRRAIDGDERIPDQSLEKLQTLYEQKTSHLAPSHLDFLRHWERLVSLEEQESVRWKKEIWTMSATHREKLGRCFANMVVDCSVSLSPGQRGFAYRLRKADGCSASLLSGHISVNDAILCSITDGAYAIAHGFVTQLDSHFVDVCVDHVLVDLACVPLSADPVTFRIDKDELLAGLGKIRDNLAQLFYVQNDPRIRELIVDLETPRFGNAVDAAEIDTSLNPDQRAAVHKVLAAQDYALILGMPGTGKTQTIAALIRHLAKCGKSVLLTSYTHSAVDNILRKIRDLGDDVLRLGNADKVAADVRSFMPESKEAAVTSAQMDTLLLKPRVVATTALAVLTHPLFLRRRFDVCIVDEASQITMPVCLGPLRHADRFVLVGDHHQLPPLVRSAQARRDGFDVSLFRRLSEAHPSAVVNLSRQYRMNSDIMAVSNRLVYADRLQCGNEVVAAQRLEASRWPDYRPEAAALWLTEALDPSRAVLFIDTDGIDATESRSGRLVHNVVEADLVRQLVSGLTAIGLDGTQIAVLTPYRQQLKTISHQLDGIAPGIEIMTADRSQGRDKDCIIVSLVRANTRHEVGELLRDWRRLNVCFTRAKCKMVVFGSRKTLEVVDQLRSFFQLADERGWVCKMGRQTVSSNVSKPVQHRSPLSALPVNV